MRPVGTRFFDLLARDLTAASFVPGTQAAAAWEELLERARRLIEVKLRFEERRSDDAPPILVIAGGTNVGKSTVFNWIVGSGVASSSPLARHTKAPTVYVHEGEVHSLDEGGFLPSYRRLHLEAPTDAAAELGEAAYFLRSHAQAPLRPVVLVDSPDIDSTHARNRRVAEDLLFLADMVIFVTTPEKYNDELCVSYLRQALELGRQPVCVLNKGGDEEVARDFREVVVPGLSERLTVLCLPYVAPRPDPTRGEARGQLAKIVADLAEEGPGLRQAARRGAMLAVGADLERVAGRLREELAELDRVRSEIALVLDARRDEYSRFLHALEFYELDRVFERLMEHFKVPVIDHVYDGIRGAFGAISSGLARVVTGRGERDARRTKLETRAETDRQKVKELIEVARAEALDLPYRHTAAVRDAVPSWVDGMPGPTIEDLNREVEAYLRRAEADAEAWIDRETRGHLELLEKHPYARNALRAMKGFFQVGFGLLSAHLTGGIGPWDVLIGGATERAAKFLLESAGGFVHYQTLKADFVRARAASFRQLLEQTVAEPLRARVPAGSDPERLERISRAAGLLRYGRIPDDPEPAAERRPAPASATEVARG